MLQIEHPLALTTKITGTRRRRLRDKTPLNTMSHPGDPSSARRAFSAYSRSSSRAMERPLQDPTQQGMPRTDIQRGAAQLALPRFDVTPVHARAAQHARPPAREVEHLQPCGLGDLRGLCERPREVLELFPVEG